MIVENLVLNFSFLMSKVIKKVLILPKNYEEIRKTVKKRGRIRGELPRVEALNCLRMAFFFETTYFNTYLFN